MSRNYSSIAQEKTLSTTISNTATQIPLNSLAGFPSPPYVLVIDPDTTTEEAVLVTSISTGTTLNVTRAIETGATAYPHSVEAVVRHMIVGSDLQAISTHTDASTGVHGLSAGVEVAGVTQSQTLTNKTINLGNNTVTGTRAQFNGSMSDDDFATINGTETLANKTLTSPTITGTLTGNVVTGANIVDSSVTSAKIVNGTIVNEDISASAAIVASKLTGTTAEFNGALSDNDFATLAGTETLTNKTINLTSNTFTGTTAQFNTALSDNNFATLTGNETLTNKHLTDPWIYQGNIYSTTTSNQTLTAANLDTRILRCTNSTASVDFTWTMPTGSALDSYFSTAAVNDAFDFTVINSASNASFPYLYIGTNTGVTIVGRNYIPAECSVTFRLRKTGTATWTVYTISLAV